MSEPRYYEIAPGYGAPGIGKARRKLLDDAVAAARKVAKKARVARNENGITVYFDDHTRLQIDFWDYHGRMSYGFDPSWYYQAAVGAPLLRPYPDKVFHHVRHYSTSILVLDEIRKLVAGLTLVEIK